MMDNPIKNASLADIRNLNALLVKELTQRIETGAANSSDLSTAQKVITAAQVQPEADAFRPSETPVFYTNGEPENLEWPVAVDTGEA